MSIAAEHSSDPRVPSYLGRILDDKGAAAGTCFQVAPGVLVTAAHVLEELGLTIGDACTVDPLQGGSERPATIARLEPVSDLAILTTDQHLDGCVAGLFATDAVPPTEKVIVTGVCQVDDPGHSYRHVDAIGDWAGGTTRDDGTPLGRITNRDVMPGMSGGPVRRLSDDQVVGVVSGRYNSVDGWLRDTVWIIRTEHLQALLVGIAEIEIASPGFAGRIDMVLTVDESIVRLVGPGLDVTAPHGGVTPGIVGAVDDVRRRRANAGLTRWEQESGPPGGAGELALRRAGRLMADSFVVPAIAQGLAAALTRAEQTHQGLRLGIQAAGPLSRLPWEALVVPGGTGPVAMHPLIDVYRRHPAQDPQQIPGPLRILVAIASPEGGGSTLDYERELGNVVRAVRSARAGAAHVQTVRFATTAAIRAALVAEQFHVLHISCHGGPGQIRLEDDQGKARSVDADRFVDEAFPPGRLPPLICLAACYTNVATAADQPSFAVRLLERGAAAVVATETSVTDRYATHLFARLYGNLAESPHPELIGALCGARRTVQAGLDAAAGGPVREIALLDEWAVVTVVTAGPTLQLYDPSVLAEVVSPAGAPRIGAVAGRQVGDFVGRQAELRKLPSKLIDSRTAGIVVWGIGGIGKTTLASELVAAVGTGEPGRRLVQLAGELNIEDLFGGIVSAIRPQVLMFDDPPPKLVRSLEIALRRDIGWQDRLAILAEHVLSAVPLLVVLDNFEDNLVGAGQAELADATLAALLSALILNPGQARLVITSRYQFTLPESADNAMEFHHLGPLTRAETSKLVWSLPALDRLDQAQVDQIWRMVGGHPRSLEYLDALLSKGSGRYPDISDRLTRAVTQKLGAERAAEFLASERTLDAALAEAAVLAADDVLLTKLLGEVSEGARSLLLGTSVYREPVGLTALLFQVGEDNESAGFTPDRTGANDRIGEILSAAGISTDDGPVDPANLPAGVIEQIGPHLAELARLPTPPLVAPQELLEWIDEASGTTLLGVDADQSNEPAFFVHRWTASELARALEHENGLQQLCDAHRGAARYWRWRVKVWPQGAREGVHDLLEARNHLLAAGDIDDACSLTEGICAQLDEWGAWDQEAALVQDTLRRLPSESDRRGAWIHQLGMLAQRRGDYAEAERLYRQSLEINEPLGNLAGMAASYHQLGMLAQDRGNYPDAERLYRQSLEINEPLSNLAGMATSYGQLGSLAQSRGDYPEAERLYRQSLEINEPLGNLAGMAASYHQLGSLAQDSGDYPEAERLYRQSLEIDERLSNLAGMAAAYHQLGSLAQDRGDYPEAERLYRQSLEIKERLGNLAGMATSYHQLGSLAQGRGDYPEAVSWSLNALAIRLRLQLSRAGNTLQMLQQLRDKLGEERFWKRVAELTDEVGADNLRSLLDELPPNPKES